MQYSTLALAALVAAASAQQTFPVLVGMNSTLTFSPDNVVAPVGSVVQFQFLAGNHTASQSTFDHPCAPVSQFSNVTGFHSGFMPVAASSGQGEMPIFSITITESTPIWVYCAQAKHCESGMSMVINENTAANSTRSLANYKSAAATVSQTTIPGNSTSDSSSGSGSSAGTTTAGSSGSGATTQAGGAASVGVSSTLSLLALVAALALSA